MDSLTGQQRRYLRSLANRLKPLVFVGKEGVTDTVIKSVEDAITAHELIKVKFIDHKDHKQPLIDEIVERTNSHQAGLVGHVALLYRQQEDPEKRKISFPES